MKAPVSGRLESAPFDNFDIQLRSLHSVASVAEGAPAVTTLQFPNPGFDALFEQQVGPVTNTGVVAGILEESSDNTNWTTIFTPTAAQTLGSRIQQRVRISKRYVRYTATVTGNGSGTAVVGASLVS